MEILFVLAPSVLALIALGFAIERGAWFQGGRVSPLRLLASYLLLLPAFAVGTCWGLVLRPWDRPSSPVPVLVGFGVFALAATTGYLVRCTGVRAGTAAEAPPVAERGRSLAVLGILVGFLLFVALLVVAAQL